MKKKITKAENRFARFADPVRSPAEFGRIIRSERKHQALTLETVYSATGLTTRFLSEFERGKSNASLGGALQAAQALGLEVLLVPRSALPRVRSVLGDVGDPAEDTQ